MKGKQNRESYILSYIHLLDKHRHWKYKVDCFISQQKIHNHNTIHAAQYIQLAENDLMCINLILNGWYNTGQVGKTASMTGMLTLFESFYQH